MTHILQITEAYEGGVRRHLRDLSLSLPRSTISTTLLLSPNRITPHEFNSDSLTYSSQGATPIPLSMQRHIAPCRDTSALYSIRRTIRQLKPNLIHAHSAKAGALARVAARQTRTPVIYTPHAFPFLMHSPPLIRHIYHSLERRLVKSTSALIVLSHQEHHAALALGYPPEKTHYIPNGITISDPPPPPPQTSHPNKLGFFGRLSRQKGAIYLLKALPLILKQSPATTLHLYGSGPEESSLRQLCTRHGLSERVIFHGTLPPEAVAPAMQQVDIIVMPSLWEGLPYTLLESWHAMRPLVATSVGGIADLLQDSSNGMLVPPANHTALADAVIKLQQHPHLCHTLTKNGWQTLTTTCTLQHMVAQTANLYHQLATQHR